MATCRLCGGKLSPEERCTECGLDNRKNDTMYHLNEHNDSKPRLHQGDCEDNLNRRRPFDMPGWKRKKQAGEKAGESAGKSRSEKQTQENRPDVRIGGAEEKARKKQRHQTGTVKKRSCLPKVLGVFLLLYLLPWLLEGVSDILYALPDWFEEQMEEDSGGSDSPEGFVSVESEVSFEAGMETAPEPEEGNPETGDGVPQEMEEPAQTAPEEVPWDRTSEAFYFARLTEGEYEVGTDFPAGSYQLECSSGHALVLLEGEETGETYLSLYSADAQAAYLESWGEESGSYAFSDVMELEEGQRLSVNVWDGSLWIRGEAAQ